MVEGPLIYSRGVGHIVFAVLNLSHVVVRPSVPACPVTELSNRALRVSVRPSVPACPLLELSHRALRVSVRSSVPACPLLELSHRALRVFMSIYHSIPLLSSSILTSLLLSSF